MLHQYDQATPRAAQLSGEDPTPVYAECHHSRQHAMTCGRSLVAEMLGDCTYITAAWNLLGVRGEHPQASRWWSRRTRPRPHRNRVYCQVDGLKPFPVTPSPYPRSLPGRKGSTMLPKLLILPSVCTPYAVSVPGDVQNLPSKLPPSSPHRIHGAANETQCECWESERGAMPPQTTEAPLVKNLGRLLTTGVITALGREGGFGFIAANTFDRPWKLMFRRATVHDDGFDRLWVGQRVRFPQEARPGNPERQQAISVEPWPEQ